MAAHWSYLFTLALGEGTSATGTDARLGSGRPARVSRDRQAGALLGESSSRRETAGAVPR
jgi:hypothetical protein